MISYVNPLNQQQEMQRIYDDSTEKSFADYDDAIAYKAYLETTLKQGEATDIYEREYYAKSELDVNAIISKDAVSKLNHQELNIISGMTLEQLNELKNNL